MLSMIAVVIDYLLVQKPRRTKGFAVGLYGELRIQKNKTVTGDLLYP